MPPTKQRARAQFIGRVLRAAETPTASDTLLVGVRYATENRFNQEHQRHELESLSVGPLNERYPDANAATTELGDSSSVSVAVANGASSLELASGHSGEEEPTTTERLNAVEFQTTQGNAVRQPENIGNVRPGDAPFMGHEVASEEPPYTAANEFSREDERVALKSDDPAIRAAAIESIEPTREGVSMLATQAKEDPVVGNRVLAVQQLGKGRGFAVTSALLAALDDPSKDVVLTALDAIANAGDHTISERVQSALKNPTDPIIEQKVKTTLETLENSVPMTPTESGPGQSEAPAANERQPVPGTEGEPIQPTGRSLSRAQ